MLCSRIDYCNSVFANLPASTIDRLDDVLHAAARLISGCRKYDHITPVMRDELHWLQMRPSIEYKLSLTVFKALHEISPGYIAAMCVPVSSLHRSHYCAQLIRANSPLFERTLNLEREPSLMPARLPGIIYQQRSNYLPLLLPSDRH